MMSGGEGAADWVTSTLGAANQQQPVSNIDNAIAAKLPASCGMKGGFKNKLQDLLQEKLQEMQQRNSQDGGSLMQQLSNLIGVFNKPRLSEQDANNAIGLMSGGSGVIENIAVPAILLYLNQKLGKKSHPSKKQKSMKLRRSYRLSAKNRK